MGHQETGMRGGAYFLVALLVGAALLVVGFAAFSVLRLGSRGRATTTADRAQSADLGVTCNATNTTLAQPPFSLARSLSLALRYAAVAHSLAVEEGIG
jgi:hypothetical protein